MDKQMEQQAALVVGVGARQGIGAAVARQAALQGLHVYVAGRSRDKIETLAKGLRDENLSVEALVCDSTQAGQIDAMFERIQASGRQLTLVVYNTGRNLPAPFMETDTRLITGHWRRCVLGGMLVGQAALRVMLEQGDGRHKGTIIYTGASASLRGKPLFAGFASAKAGLRAMAQSMAREFGPQGIHVAHVVIDGLVDGAVVRSIGPLGRLLLKQKGDCGALMPDEVAKNFWMLHQQVPSAWTHELDLRPYKEKF